MMTKQKYELLNENISITSNRKTLVQILILILLCAFTTFAVFIIWAEIYNNKLNLPQKTNDIPQLWLHRTNQYVRHHNTQNYSATLVEASSNNNNNSNSNINNESLEAVPSKYGNFIYTDEKNSVETDLKLICYYSTPIYKKGFTRNLLPNAIDPHLCTHLNIGIVDIANCTLQISDVLIETFKQTEALKAKNDKLKILLWVGGAGEVSGFSEMVSNHTNRKKFIQSLKATLEEYRLDGIDLDWEFPNGFSKERMHFSQLLHEIRREYQREHRTYLLSLAVAAPAVFVDMSYDVPQINDNVDYINIMTYDYHFYSKETPYTGLNAPLYKRHNEIGFFATLNINYTVNYWMSKGLNRSKIVIGLPTYGHSFRLVNPFNTRMGAPAEGFGSVGASGFVTYSDVCYFRKMNFNVRMQYDVETCSPYLFTGNEWISYEDERSLTCKTNFMKNNNFAGIMVFSLNTDDYVSDCDDSKLNENAVRKGEKTDFPLLRKIHSILFQNATH